jgi:flagellar basal-body rod modification protein FlgD
MMMPPIDATQAAAGMDPTAQAINAQASLDAQKSGKEDFMKIFMAQLRNQDPMEPMDNKDMVAQLAQMNGLEQAIETNRQLTALQGMNATQGRTAMAGLIGKNVEADVSSLHYDRQSAEPVAFSFTLDAPAKEVTVEILDGRGHPVRTLHVPGGATGVAQTAAWDGNTDSGSAASSGAYEVRMSAVREGGSQQLPARISGVASGVGFDADGAAILVGNVRVRPQELARISQ